MIAPSKEFRPGHPSQCTVDDLSMALGALATFQSYVRQADAKVRTVVTAQAAVCTALSVRGDIGVLGGLTGAPAAFRTSTAAVFLAALLISCGYLAQALRPRTRQPCVPTRFGIQAADGRPCGAPATSSAEVWAMVGVLADVARVKHRHVSRAIRWTVVALLALVARIAVGG